MAAREKYSIPVNDPPVQYYFGSEIERAEARELGLVRYFTGKPCCKGHIAERHVSTAACIQCGLERHRTPDYRADMRPGWRDRYQTDEEFRERRKAHSRKWWHARGS